MARQSAVHVTTQRRHYTGKDGRERVYETHLLRRSWREGGKVRNETVANLSKLPPETIELIRASLAGQRFVPAGQQAQVARSLPHGHAAAVHEAARKLGLPALLGPACRERDLAFALVISQVLRPASKLSTIGWWGDVTLGADLGVVGASADEVYAAMDWLTARQDGIERQLGRRHLRDGGIAMFDFSSSWVEGGPQLICMLACYLTWHLRQAWAPLTSPVAPASRYPSASAKASRQTGPGNQPIRTFREIIDHLATLTRNDLRYGQGVIPALAEPTPTQRRAFDLIGTPIPLTLTT